MISQICFSKHQTLTAVLKDFGVKETHEDKAQGLASSVGISHSLPVNDEVP